MRLVQFILTHIHTFSIALHGWSVITVSSSIRIQPVFSSFPSFPSLILLSIHSQNYQGAWVLLQRLQLWSWLEWQCNEEKAEKREEWWLVWLSELGRSEQVISIFMGWWISVFFSHILEIYVVCINGSLLSPLLHLSHFPLVPVLYYLCDAVFLFAWFLSTINTCHH